MIVAAPLEAEPHDYYALLKPRIMQVVVFTALVGLVLAPSQQHPFLSFIVASMHRRRRRRERRA